MGVFEIVRFLLNPLRQCQIYNLPEEEDETKSQNIVHTPLDTDDKCGSDVELFDIELEEEGNAVDLDISDSLTEEFHFFSHLIEDPYVNQISDIVNSRKDLGLTDLARYLSSQGYIVFKRTVNNRLGSLKRLKNTFLVVKRHQNNQDNNIWATNMVEIFIELDFKEHFIPPFYSKQHLALMNKVPVFMTATDVQFRSLVKFLTKQMQDVFSEKKATIPPWRTQEAMLSNWFSDVCLDQEIHDLESVYFPTDVSGSKSLVDSSALCNKTWNEDSVPCDSVHKVH